MAKLIFSLDGAYLRDITLDQGRITIGRRASNDVHIDNLAVSGEHAAINTIGNDSFLEDLGSTNGTLVNGKSVARHVLQHGDVIELGKYQLKYVNEAAARGDEQDDFEKTMVIRSPVLETPAPAAVKVTTGAADSTPSWRPVGKLQVLNGASVGKELVLSKALVTLGKAGVQVAVITRRAQGYFITHVEGATFPTVNGNSVGGQAYPLKDHDVIELAGVKMEFYLA